MLREVQLSVHATALQKFRVRPDLNDAASLHDDNLIGVHDGGKPVSDN